MKQRPAGLRNGIIGFLASGRLPGRIYSSIAITNTFPMIYLKAAVLHFVDGSTADVAAYDHLSVPPDLRLHLSGRAANPIYFDVSSVWQLIAEGDASRAAHCFSVISRPFKDLDRFPLPAKRKRVSQALFVSPKPDAHFNSNTRLVLDFFVHYRHTPMEAIADHPPIRGGVRHANDAHGDVVGPFPFNSLQRRDSRQPDSVGFSIRMGFAELGAEPMMHLIVPLPVFPGRGLERAGDTEEDDSAQARLDRP